jgi:hypothetical protein
MVSVHCSKYCTMVLVMMAWRKPFEQALHWQKDGLF